MKQKILVTYASRTRSTQSVADAIAEVLVKRGASVDMRFILDVSDVSPYDAIVIGSSIRTGHWLPEATRFIKIYQEQLRQKSVAYFVVCMTLYQNTPENREKILSALNPMCQIVKPVDIGLFGGILERKKTEINLAYSFPIYRFSRGRFSGFSSNSCLGGTIGRKIITKNSHCLNLDFPKE
jgi:menaquinone-dependent protoporphyrinogen oxidase